LSWPILVRRYNGKVYEFAQIAMPQPQLSLGFKARMSPNGETLIL
jgi:hypothetical protein